MADLQFGRIIPAMVTPFDEQGNVDFARAQKLALRLLDCGCDSLLVCATTGEAPTIAHDDRIALFSAVVEAVDGKAPVIAYAGDNCTEDSVILSQRAAKTGVDGLLNVVPYYNKPPQEGMYRHFRSIAESVDIPCMLYNVPGRTVVNMQAETTLRLANDVENIVGIKEASGNIDQIAQICNEAPEGFVVYSGDDDMTLQIMEVGGVGVISTMANVAPHLMRALVDAFVAGDMDKARATHELAHPLMKELFITANPIMIKKAMELNGFSCGSLRLPLVEANQEQTTSLRHVMASLDLLA